MHDVIKRSVVTVAARLLTVTLSWALNTNWLKQRVSCEVINLNLWLDIEIVKGRASVAWYVEEQHGSVVL